MINEPTIKQLVLSYQQVLNVLPEVKYLVENIQTRYRKTHNLRKKYDKLYHSNLPDRNLRREMFFIERKFMHEYKIMEEIAEDIEDLGGILQSAEKGLVDFIVYKEEKRVYLCWKADDNELFWHSIDDKCNNRKQVNPKILDGGMN